MIINIRPKQFIKKINFCCSEMSFAYLDHIFPDVLPGVDGFQFRFCPFCGGRIKIINESNLPEAETSREFFSAESGVDLYADSGKD